MDDFWLVRILVKARIFNPYMPGGGVIMYQKLNGELILFLAL